MPHIAVPNAEKSNWQPRKLAEWLGYEWNFNDFSVKVSERRENNFMIRFKDLKEKSCFCCRFFNFYVFSATREMFII